MSLTSPHLCCSTHSCISVIRVHLILIVYQIHISQRSFRELMTRDLFKKIRDTKGTFHAKMGSIKDRNGMDLTEAQDIKKRWQEYTEELYKKDLHDQDNHDGVITDLEPDILECEVKWALESITTNKACGGDGIPVELFQILKDDAVKVRDSICQQIWKTQQWPEDWKRSVFIPIPKKGNAKECSNYCTIALISHVSRRRQWHPTPVLLPGRSHGRRSLVGCSPWGHEESDKTDLTLTFNFHALEKETATHSSVLAWRIPGTGEPGGLPSMGSTESDTTEVT